MSRLLPALRRLAAAGPLLVAIGASFATGCALNRPKRFPVSDSSLNWMELVYLDTARTGGAVRVSLIGNGGIQVRRGTSPRVLDDFAADTENPTWQDFHRDELYIPAADMRRVFQSFVNRGVCDPEGKHPPDAPVLPMAKIHGRLDGERFFRHTTEPALLDVVTNLLTLVEQAGQAPPLDQR